MGCLKDFVQFLQRISAGGLSNLFLSLSIAFTQQNFPWASPTLQSRATQPIEQQEAALGTAKAHLWSQK